MGVSNISVEAARAELAAEADADVLERAKRIDAQAKAAADKDKRAERALRGYEQARQVYVDVDARTMTQAEVMISICQEREAAEKRCSAAFREALDACDGAISPRPESFSQLLVRNGDEGYAARKLKAAWDRFVRL